MIIRNTPVERMRNASNSIEVITNLVNVLPEVAFVTLAELKVSPPGRNKEIAKIPDLKVLTSEALSIREKYHIPFWMAVIFVAQSRELTLPEQLLRAAAFHQPMAAAKIEQLPVKKVTKDYLLKRSEMVEPGQILTFSSRLMLHDGTEAHIPMLDFRLSSSSETLPTAMAVIRQLGINGVMLDSGQSYHFYGLALISSEELRKFLAKALLFTPVIDYRWIAHQLIEGACALRLSSGAEQQKIPTTVAILTGQSDAKLAQ
jgi:hypothetical protein